MLPLSGGPEVGLRSSSSLLSQAPGSGSSGCPLLRVSRRPSGPSHVVSCGDQTGPQPSDSSPAVRWPWAGRPAPRPPQLEPPGSHCMRGGASAPPRPSLSAQLFKDPPHLVRVAGQPHLTITGTLPLLLCPLLWVPPSAPRRGLLRPEPARPGCPLCWAESVP